MKKANANLQFAKIKQEHEHRKGFRTLRTGSALRSLIPGRGENCHRFGAIHINIWRLVLNIFPG